MAKELNNKQRAFVDEYLQCWNASESVRRTGYKGKNADVIGSRMLVHVGIRAEIERRLSEKAMGANEVLARLAEQARGEASQYVVIGADNKPGVDVAKMITDGKQHLIKGISYTRSGDVVVDTYDAQSALEKIGRHHKLFTDKVEVDDTGITDEQRADRIARILDAARARRAG